MKKILFPLLIMWFGYTISKSKEYKISQQVKNVHFEQNNNKVYIYFDLIDSNVDSEYNIILLMSHNSGYTFTDTIKNISGDISSIYPGENKKVIWTPSQEFIDKGRFDNICFRVVAQKILKDKKISRKKRYNYHRTRFISPKYREKLYNNNVKISFYYRPNTNLVFKIYLYKYKNGRYRYHRFYYRRAYSNTHQTINTKLEDGYYKCKVLVYLRYRYYWQYRNKYCGYVTSKFSVKNLPKPEAPKNLSIIAKDNNKIQLKWDKVDYKESSKLSYKVEVTDNENNTKIYNTNKNNIDIDLNSEQQTNYRVASYVKEINKSNFSPKVGYLQIPNDEEVDAPSLNIGFSINYPEMKDESCKVHIYTITDDGVYNLENYYDSKNNKKIPYFFSYNNYLISVRFKRYRKEDLVYKFNLNKSWIKSTYNTEVIDNNEKMYGKVKYEFYNGAGKFIKRLNNDSKSLPLAHFSSKNLGIVKVISENKTIVYNIKNSYVRATNVSLTQSNSKISIDYEIQSKANDENKFFAKVFDERINELKGIKYSYTNNGNKYKMEITNIPNKNQGLFIKLYSLSNYNPPYMFKQIYYKYRK